MIRKRNETSFKDFLFLTISGLAALFVLAFISMNPTAKTQDAPARAEYMLIIEWDDYVGDDIDMWVRDPRGKVLSFRNKQIGLLSLEKDDLGTSNDTFIDSYGKQQIVPINREVVTIRGVQPGQYNVAFHVYSLMSYDVLASNFKYFKLKNLTPNEVNERRKVRFTLIRLNPLYTEGFKVEKQYETVGQEIHLVNFTVLEDGSISDINTDPIKIIYRTIVAPDTPN